LNLGNMILLLLICLGTEAIRRDQLGDVVPFVGDNNLAPASLPRLLQQLLYTSKEEFQVPGAQNDVSATNSAAKNPPSILETQATTNTNSPVSASQMKDNNKNEISPNLQKDSKSVNLLETKTKMKEEGEPEQDVYLIKLERPPIQDVLPPITGDNCTDEKIRADRDQLKALEKDIEKRENEKRLHHLWIEEAKNAIKKKLKNKLIKQNQVLI